ncbi:MAG: hypothetical protein ABR535_07605 [Pyrinomonadaceae bacterium]
MVNRNARNIHNIEDLNDETHTVPNFGKRLLSSRKIRKDKSVNDDLIVLLSDAHENKRARQVSEWEHVSGRQFYRVA